MELGLLIRKQQFYIILQIFGVNKSFKMTFFELIMHFKDKIVVKEKIDIKSTTY